MKVLKLIGIALVAVLCFAGAMAGLLAYSGNLSKEGIDKLLYPKSAGQKAVETPAEKGDESSALAQALKQREEELNQRETKMRDEEERSKKSRADLDALRTEVQAMQAKIGASIKIVDADHKKRMEDVALSLSKMKATNAAESIGSWPVEDAVAVLRFVKDKERAKILDAMKPEQSSVLLLGLQDKKL